MELKTDYSNVKFADNGKLKLLIIVGTRPEIIRLAAVIDKCRKYFDCILAHTGQNYDYNLNGVFFSISEDSPPQWQTTSLSSKFTCVLEVTLSPLGKTASIIALTE